MSKPKKLGGYTSRTREESHKRFKEFETEMSKPKRLWKLQEPEDFCIKCEELKSKVERMTNVVNLVDILLEDYQNGNDFDIEAHISALMKHFARLKEKK